ncbi:MAG: hypothetical protein JJE51_15025, partial [Thermoanaerobaculia bacterium]|nr:hypothetical protein [Thermoanaerobaculia bacterium]
MSWKEALRAVAADLEQTIDGNRLTLPFPDRRRALIVPYRGIGRANELLLRGRVIADRKITRGREAEPLWRNLVNAYRRFQSDELAGVPIRASYRDAVVESVTDEEGHFQIRLQPELMDESKMWHEVQLSGAGSTATAQALIPPAHAEFGIISDIDDTIVETGATSLRTMMQTVLLRNAAMRTAFDGVADLYHALHRDANPLFYVSSGPWNLY